MTTLPAAEARLAALETTANLAWWEMSCNGTDDASAAAEAASAAYEHALAEPAIAAAAVAVDGSPLEQRRAEVLRLMTAGRVGWKSDRARIRVATKFVNITRRHFASQGVHADVIKLYGAMELAPIMNLAELIVDIVDTGNTLKANGMEPLEEIAAISSRLIVNKAAMRSRHAIIQRVIDDLAQIVSQQSSGA